MAFSYNDSTDRMFASLYANSNSRTATARTTEEKWASLYVNSSSHSNTYQTALYTGLCNTSFGGGSFRGATNNSYSPTAGSWSSDYKI